MKQLRKNGEIITPRTSINLVMDSEGKRLPKILEEHQANIKVPEILQNTGTGDKYLSNDGTYKELPPPNPNEQIYITISSNQTAINNAIVTVTLEDGSIQTYNWEGNVIYLELAYGTDYTVSVSDIANYKTPSPQSFKAKPQNERRIEFVYQASIINFDSNVEATILVNGVSISTSSSVQIPLGSQVIVEPQEVFGYVTPVSQTIIADTVTKTITLNYIESKLKLDILSSQGEDPNIATVNAVVTWDGGSDTISNGETIAIPIGKEITVSFPDVEGYATPNNIVFTHYGGIYTDNITYVKTYTLTVNIAGISSGFSASVVYGNITETQTTASKVYTVAKGDSYSVTGGAVTGYNVSGDASGVMTDNVEVTLTYIPKTYTLTVKVSGLSSGFSLTVKYGSTTKTQTAKSATYTVSHGQSWSVIGNNYMADSGTYIASSGQNGVMSANKTITIKYTYRDGFKSPCADICIQDSDSYYHYVSSWNGTYTPSSIYVSGILVALQDTHSSCTFGDQNTLVTGIITTTSESTALSDYEGKSNTTTIVNQLGSSALPAWYCYNYTFPNGQTGYLGSAGEWQIILNNMSSFYEALMKCGGTALDSYYWTSTQYDSTYFWCAQTNNGRGDEPDIYMWISGRPKFYTHRVRAFGKVNW